MTKKFLGTLVELQAYADQVGMHGEWEPEPNGVYMLRMECGVNMHWASTTKTVWFDGPVAAQQRLALKLCLLEAPQRGLLNAPKLLLK